VDANKFNLSGRDVTYCMQVTTTTTCKDIDMSTAVHPFAKAPTLNSLQSAMEPPLAPEPNNWRIIPHPSRK